MSIVQRIPPSESVFSRSNPGSGIGIIDITWYLFLFNMWQNMSLGVMKVADLPAAGTIGRTAFVTDATSAVFNASVVGGGTNVVPIFDNGTAWVIG